MKCSIILPVYNTKSEYLEFNLNELILINEKDIEIIIVDDGSDNYIKTICKKYEEIDNRIKYFKIKNSGVSTARNYGVIKSKGDYIIFLDADDYLNINIINKIDFYKESYDIIIYNYNRVYNNKTILRKLNIEYGIYNKERLNIILEKLVSSYLLNSIHSKIYKSDIIKKNNIKFPSEVKIGEDTIFNLQYFERCKSVQYIDEVLTNYRIYETSSVKKFPISRFKDLEKEFESRLNFYKNNIVFIKELEKNIYIYNQSLLFMNVLNSRVCKNSFYDIFCYLKSSKKIQQLIKYKEVGFINRIKMLLIKYEMKFILEIICLLKKIKGLI